MMLPVMGVISGCTKVEPRSHKVLVVHGKPEGLNKVQFASGIGAQPDDVAGIGRNLRMH